MRDYLLNYGVVSLVSAGTEKVAPNVLEGLGPLQTIGQKASVNIIARPSRDLATTETLSLKFEESDDDTDANFKPIATYTAEAGVVNEANVDIKFRFPRATKKFTRVKASIAGSTATTNVDIFIQHG